MAITSINPATGKTIKTYDEMTPEQAAAAVAQAHETWRTWRATSFAERAKPMKKTAECCASARTSSQSLWPWRWANRCAGRRGSREMRLGVRLLRRQRGSAPGAGGHQDGSRQILCRVRAARRRAGDHAVEFSAVAGLSVRRSRAHGRQRRRAEARLQRAGLRAGHRRDLQPGRLS